MERKTKFLILCFIILFASIGMIIPASIMLVRNGDKQDKLNGECNDCRIAHRPNRITKLDCPSCREISNATATGLIIGGCFSFALAIGMFVLYSDIRNDPDF